MHLQYTCSLVPSPNLHPVSTQPLPMIKWEPIKANRPVDCYGIIGDLRNR